jgi:lipopolysaccharide/colanic/teichoic acid biosynthesis glycosyltransferase
MLRFFDAFLSAVGLVLFCPIVLILIAIGLCETGSPLFLQTRVGRRKKPFTLIKLRTMLPDTASVPTHMVDVAAVTTFGRFLRRTKLDELPQLWNVLKGEMSLVGPRPCLFSQHELIEARDALGVFEARPGITGLAQISGVDMSSPALLAEIDAKMLGALDAGSYFRCILLTIAGRGKGDRIKQYAGLKPRI